MLLLQKPVLITTSQRTDILINIINFVFKEIKIPIKYQCLK